VGIDKDLSIHNDQKSLKGSQMKSRFFKRMFKVAGGAALAVALIAGGSASAQAAQDPASPSGLALSEMALLGSDQPKTVKIDPASGAVLSVTPGQPVQARGVKSNCTGDFACWNGRPPALSYGFNGSGASGDWPNRGSFSTGNYTATLCWSYGPTPFSKGYCMKEAERAGQNSTIEIGSVVVGTRVSLSR
jgi:hypothetical protein